MQLQLPLFPEGTHMISDGLGFYVKDDIVQYIVMACLPMRMVNLIINPSDLLPVILLIWAYARKPRCSVLFM